MSEGECQCVGCKKKLEEIAKNEDADRVVCFCGQRDKLGGVPLVITINRLNKKQGDAGADSGPKPETAEAFTQVTPKESEHKPKKKKKKCTII